MLRRFNRATSAEGTRALEIDIIRLKTLGIKSADSARDTLELVLLIVIGKVGIDII